ncbi:DUF2490 domain-containing protein [bacterium]|nr:DUF2490 domain-containing protein [candidate division CSSED10-310 bacterium]
MKKLFVVAFIVSGILVGAGVYADSDADWQFWNTYRIEGKLCNLLKVGLEEQFRFGDDMTDLAYQHTEIQTTWAIMKFFDLGLNYRHIYTLSGESWAEENRPMIDGTLKFKSKSFGVSDRNRFEYRVRKDKDEAWRYRNKITLSCVRLIEKNRIEPYIANEFYYDFDADSFNKNRIYAGAKIQLSKAVQGDLYYLLESTEKNDVWTDVHVLGLTFKFSFK